MRKAIISWILGVGYRLFFFLMVFCLLPLLCLSSDWPQHQFDAARSGCTPDMPIPPYKQDWQYDFAQQDRDKIYPIVQPIVYGGKVFVGSTNGRLYAIDAVSGKKAWVWEGAGPILNTAGASDGLVFFGSLDGHLYAVRADDGELAWKFFSDIRGFSAAPCLADGKVFIGGRSGVFYAIEQATGKPVWRTETGGHIFHTAACADGRVYVGNEELKALCLDAANGGILWKTERLYGLTFKDGFAFADQGKVVVRTWNAGAPISMPLDGTALKVSADAGKYLPVPDAHQDQVLAKLEADPVWFRDLYVLDAQTGEELYMPVHGKASTVDGPAFSVCRDSEGWWYLAMCVEQPKSEPSRSTWMTFMRMDPKTGRLKDYLWTPDAGSSSDEANAFTVGGHMLFCSEQEEGECGFFGIFDLETPRMFNLSTSTGGMEYDSQPLANSVVIAGDRFYKVSNHALRCWKGSK